MSRKLKILVISQYYPPENALIAADVASELSQRGHHVRVLTGYPNYPQGKIFPGYRQRWRQHDLHEGIEVLRVPLFVDHSQSLIRRVANYLSFGISAATARNFGRSADIIYVYATQMTPAIGPWLWRLTGGAPYVLHVQDLWPDSITGSSISGGGIRSRVIEILLNPWIGHVYKRAAAVIGIAPTMVDTLIKRGVVRERAELVYNWSADAKPAIVSSPESNSTRTQTHVVYAGNVGEMQDLETALRAAVKAANSGLLLTFIGDGVAKPALMRLAKVLEATNVEFKDRVPREEMQAVYAQADFGLVTLKDLPVFRGTVPSKFQALLANGLPIITNVQGDLRTLSEQHRLGFTSDAESVQSLEDAFRRAAGYPEHERVVMADRARTTAKKLFTKDASITRIESILQHAAGKEKKR